MPSQSIKINPDLFTAMLSSYATVVFKQMVKEFKKSSYVMGISCKTASDFDKARGLIELDKIHDFVVLQIIARLTSNDDNNYSPEIEACKDSLIINTGLTFNDDSIDEVKGMMYNDIRVSNLVHDLASTKLLKIAEEFNDEVSYLTKSFCNVCSQ